jgi:hypothetical protein
MDQYTYLNVLNPYTLEQDPDIKMIRVDNLDLIKRSYRLHGMPEPSDFPDIKKAIGHGLPPDEQIFKREVWPDGIIKLESTLRNKEDKNKRLAPVRKKLNIINNFWDELESHPKKYYAEIQWLEKMWHYRLFGAFILINGKMTYMTGSNVMYLNFWPLDLIPPEYRDRDRRWFIAQKFAQTDTTTFAKWEEKGNKRIPIPESDGSYKMIDLRRIICLGSSLPKGRRMGDTSKCCEDSFEYITRVRGQHFGFQGKNETHSRAKFQENISLPFSTFPFFMIPQWDSGLKVQPKERILFESDESGYGIHTRITYATTSKSEHYNSDRLDRYIRDESGNCLKYDTNVLMFNGRFKKVQDIKVGEQLMGIDSTPRNVLSLGRGMEMMYDIIPNRGVKWGCNESHLLALRMCSTRSKSLQKGDVKIISVKDYSKLSSTTKRHFNLFRAGIDFPAKEHLIDPYFIGAWLGDGRSAWCSLSISERELADYIYDFAANLGLTVNKIDEFSKKLNRLSKSSVYNIRGSINGRYCNNILLHEMRRLSLLNNKHIPDEYLYDSEENRLKLLAGLIDTDGNKIQKTNSFAYEISQVNTMLADQITYLVRSLGFNCNNKKKKTKSSGICNYLKEGITNRMSIYGTTLYKIPCKIPYKRIESQHYAKTSKGRNPMHTGFKVVETGIGDYYGFTIDGDHLFMVEDFTVTHNTVGEQIDIGHDTVKKCAKVGSNIRGFFYYPTTINDMEDITAARHYIQLVKNSMYHERDENGQTVSGMYNFYFCAADGREGQIDKFGASIIDTPTPEQASFTGREIGAKQEIESERKELKRTKQWDKLAKAKRQDSLCFKEIYSPPVKNTFFRTDLIEPYVTTLWTYPELCARKGNFFWKDKSKGIVDWDDCTENPEKGKFSISRKFGDNEINKKYMKGGVWYPENPTLFILTADTVTGAKPTGRASNAAICVRERRNELIDPDDKDISKWETARTIITYSNRPDDLDEFLEDVLMCAIYTGSMVYAERNIDNVNRYFEDEKYKGYLLFDYDENGKPRNEAGYWLGGWEKKEMFILMKQDHLKTIGRCPHVEIWQEALEITSPDELTDFDLTAAYGGTLLAEKNRFYKFYSAMPQRRTVDFFPQKTY